jgi:hypothetical protein
LADFIVPKKGRDYAEVIARGSHLQRTRGGPKRESVVETYDEEDEDDEAEEAEEEEEVAGAGARGA